MEEETPREWSRKISDRFLPQKEEGGHECRDEKKARAVSTAGFEVQSAGAVNGGRQGRREGGREGGRERGMVGMTEYMHKAGY